MNKFGRKKLSLAVVNALGAGMVVGMAAPMAYAQQTTPATTTTATPQRIERVEITGSRLPSPTLESTSPVNVISAQDIKWDGITNTADILNQLPSAFADYGNNISNGGTGTASVNLRNLGASRTLVLIDGKRLPAGSPTFWATDINTIPAPLIDRIEVLTGGASAVYGSDAVAGVVNFIMNDHFEGVQVQWNANGFNHQQSGGYGDLALRAVTSPAQFQVPGDVGLDGQTQNFNMLMGSNFANGKGNATLYFQYRHENAILQGSRNYSACALSTGFSTTSALKCGGSATSASGYFYNGATGSGAFTIANAAGDVRPFKTSDQFNFGPYNYYQVPQEQYSFNEFAHYDVFPQVRVYGEFDFSSTNTTTQVAPGGEFFDKQFPISYNNPLVSQNAKDAFGITPDLPGSLYVGRRNVEGGGRNQQILLQDYRYVLGAKGDLFDNTWNYNGWWQSGRNQLTNNYGNYFSIVKIGRALDVVTDPKTGKPVCASVLDKTDPNCVPWDIWHTGAVTKAQTDYLNTPASSNGYTSQTVLGLQFDSDLGASYGWRTPWAKNGAAVAFGYERRTEKLVYNVDQLLQSGDLSGFGGASPPISGQYTVNEGYVEARLPIMEQQQYAYLLSVNGAYRYSSYSTNFNANSYGLGLEWAPVRDYKFRGTYQQAVRAPNIIELYTPASTGLFNMYSDPCGGPNPTATQAQCARSGLSAANFGKNNLNNPAGQYNISTGGNPNLKAETANTYTLGLVMTPLPNLSATIDYWNIDLKDAIGINPATFELNSCIFNGQLCDRVHRDPTSGSLWKGSGLLDGVNQNIGGQSTDGIDFTLNYSQPIQDWGSVNVNWVATYLNKFDVQPISGSGSYDCAGLYGVVCGTPLPVWRSKIRGTWNTPWYNTALSLAWRYFDSVKIDASSGNPLLAAPYNPINGSLSAQNYIDIAASWNIDKNFTLYAGCNNVFDKNPPILSSSIAGPPYGNGNTYPQVYDALGRNLFISITAKF
jgi:iron complex outermembrane receptor protein